MTSATRALPRTPEKWDRWTIPAGALHEVPRVRHQVMDRLRSLAGDDADLDAAELVVGELVGNAVRHTGGPTWVSLRQDGARLRLEVADRGPRWFPAGDEPPDDLAESGRGLFLVRRLALELDVRRRAGGGSVVSVLLDVRLPRSA
jgi:anti-sigma regulatory factor (Ser/Thr protein kinase)